MSVKGLFDRFCALFMPDRCAFCDKLMEHLGSELYICESCAAELIFSDEVSTCRICGRRLPDEETLCDTCRTHTHYFDKAITCLTYEFSVRESILQFKFGNHADHLRTFVALLTRRLRPFCEDYAFDLVVCAPISKSGFNERGFNQAEEIAKRVAKNLGLSFSKNAFRKTKETPKQSTLHYAERFKNVADAFRLTLAREQVKGKTFLLIDDVLTTGATADALARLLKKAGAKTVIVATVAGTEPDRADKPATVDWNELIF